MFERAVVVLVLLLVGCSAPAPRPRTVITRIDLDALPYAPSPWVPVRAPTTVLEAENAVRYCKEAWDANVWAGADAGPAARRLAKALEDLGRVKGGETELRVEGPGGFPYPMGTWVSGYHRADGMYVPGHPLGGVGLGAAIAMASTDVLVEAALAKP